MIITETGINGLLILEPVVHKDERGYFFESYNKNILTGSGIKLDFVQDNQSKSSYGIVRGLHFQLIPFAQTKLIRVLEGTIFDVAVDLRKKSSTFGKWFGIELSSENMKQLIVPKGLAHGFSVLSPSAVVFYKCDEFYNPGAERGIIYNDPELNIDWQIPADQIIVSKRDRGLPGFKEVEMNF